MDNVQPSINVPEISISDISVGDISTSEITTKNIDVPPITVANIQPPNFKIKEINPPDIRIPDIPQRAFTIQPDVEIADVTMGNNTNADPTGSTYIIGQNDSGSNYVQNTNANSDGYTVKVNNRDIPMSFVFPINSGTIVTQADATNAKFLDFTDQSRVGYVEKNKDLPFLFSQSSWSFMQSPLNLDSWHYVGQNASGQFWDGFIQEIDWLPIGNTSIPPFSIPIAMFRNGGPRPKEIGGQTRSTLSSYAQTVAPSYATTDGASGNTIGIYRSSTQGIVFQCPGFNGDQIHLQSDGDVPSQILCELSSTFFPGAISGTAGIKFLSCDDTYAYACCDSGLIVACKLADGTVLYGTVDEGHYFGEPIIDNNGTINILTGDGFSDNSYKDGIGNYLSMPETFGGQNQNLGVPNFYVYQFRTDTLNMDGSMTRLSKVTAGTFAGGYLPLGYCLTTPSVGQAGTATLRTLPAGIMGYGGQNGTKDPGKNGSAFLFDTNTNTSMFAVQNGANVIGAWSHDSNSFLWTVNGGTNATAQSDGMGGFFYEVLIPIMATQAQDDSTIVSGGSPNGACYLVQYNHCQGTTVTFYSPFTNNSYTFPTDNTGAIGSTVGEAISDSLAIFNTYTDLTGAGPLPVWQPITNYWGLRLYDALTGEIVADYQYPTNPMTITGTQNAGDSTPSGETIHWFGGEYFVSPTCRVASGSVSGANGTTVTSPISISSDEVIVDGITIFDYTANPSVPSTIQGGLSLEPYGTAVYSPTVFVTNPPSYSTNVTFIAFIVAAPSGSFTFDPGPGSMNGLMFSTDPAQNGLVQMPNNVSFDIAGTGFSPQPSCNPITGAPQQAQIIGFQLGTPSLTVLNTATFGTVVGGFSNPCSIGNASTTIFLQRHAVSGNTTLYGWQSIEFGLGVGGGNGTGSGVPSLIAASTNDDAIPGNDTPGLNIITANNNLITIDTLGDFGNSSTFSSFWAMS